MENPDTSLFAGKKILIAEDNALNQLIVKRILAKLPLELTLVDDGKKAVEACKNQDFDVIFLDIQMPVLDGYAAARQIREIPIETARNTPIIAFTASVDDELPAYVQASGMTGFLLKPFTPEALYETIEKYLR